MNTGMSVTGPNDYVCGMVNEIIKAGCSAEGSYCMGMICCLAWTNNLQPNRTVLETASTCKTVPEAIALWKEWEKAQTGK